MGEHPSEGQTRDLATQSLANTLSSLSPESAAKWADSIQDENIRSNTQTHVGMTWIRTDPEAARAWTEKSSLPRKNKEWILKELQKSP